MNKEEKKEKAVWSLSEEGNPVKIKLRVDGLIPLEWGSCTFIKQLDSTQSFERKIL